jgi:hypothetical protein
MSQIGFVISYSTIEIYECNELMLIQVPGPIVKCYTEEEPHSDLPKWPSAEDVKLNSALDFHEVCIHGFICSCFYCSICLSTSNQMY